MTALALIFTLSAIGISETVYLIRKRIAAEKPICPIGGGCEIVLTSKYNKTLFIHNDLLGLLFYITNSFIAAFLVIGVPPIDIWSRLLVFMVVAGSLMSLYFFILQWRFIKAWCFWCLMSAATIWSMALILLINSLV